MRYKGASRTLKGETDANLQKIIKPQKVWPIHMYELEWGDSVEKVCLPLPRTQNNTGHIELVEHRNDSRQEAVPELGFLTDEIVLWLLWIFCIHNFIFDRLYPGMCVCVIQLVNMQNNAWT